MPGSSPPTPGPSSATSTVLGARDHARAQEASDGAQAITTRPTIPASAATDLPDGVDSATVVWDETLGAGGYASRVVRRGVHVRIADVGGGANVNLMLHHAARPIERLNVADTVKLQWNAYPGAGSLLLSDMGRVLCTVLPDSTGPLDLLCGASPDLGRRRLLLGLAKQGLTRRDLPPALNVFSFVRVEADGGLRLDTPEAGGDSRGSGGTGPDPRRHITLRAELDVLVTLAVTPHPLDDGPGAGGAAAADAGEGADRDATAAPDASVGADHGAIVGAGAAGAGAGGAGGGGIAPRRRLVRVTAWQGEPAGPDDPARVVSPEARRAFENTGDVLTALAGGALA